MIVRGYIASVALLGLIANASRVVSTLSVKRLSTGYSCYLSSTVQGGYLVGFRRSQVIMTDMATRRFIYALAQGSGLCVVTYGAKCGMGYSA